MAYRALRTLHGSYGTVKRDAIFTPSPDAAQKLEERGLIERVYERKDKAYVPPTPAPTKLKTQDAEAPKKPAGPDVQTKDTKKSSK